MLAVLSPSKTLDFETRSRKKTHTVPERWTSPNRLWSGWRNVSASIVQTQCSVRRRYAGKCETSLN